jgi:hypothetical protein
MKQPNIIRFPVNVSPKSKQAAQQAKIVRMSIPLRRAA